MPVEIKMPRLSDTMDEGKIVEWNVKAGDHVDEGDLLCVIETDKADVEFQSFYAGTITEIRVREGEVAPLGVVIAMLTEEGEETAPARDDALISPSRDALGDLSPLSPMRRTIARRMEQSWTAAPHFTLTMRVDMTRAADFRNDFRRAHPDAKITMNDLIVAASGRALRAFPAVNASYEEGKVRMLRDVNVGIAVAVEDGLITPVIRNADQKSLEEISAEGRDLASRGRARRLQPEEYRGGSFTVSNLGMLGVDEFAAIMNPPEGAILAVGAIRETPVASEGRVRTAPLMKMTLSCDHRIIDGATGARFLGKLKELLENPDRLTR